MDYESKEFLEKLKSIPWETVSKIYGNDHSALIGLILHWWINQNKDNWACESGISCGHHPKNLGGQVCDAVLCKGQNPIGILEVEGSRYKQTLEKIGKFFDSNDFGLGHIKFAIYLLYPIEPRGRGKLRAFPDLKKDIVGLTPLPNFDKPIAIILISKKFERERPEIRKKNDYFSGKVTSAYAYLVLNGIIKVNLPLFEG